jgi:hypothetical protein
MSGVSEISEDLTNYGISCHPETGTFGEFPISLWRFWFELSPLQPKIPAQDEHVFRDFVTPYAAT